MASPLSADQVRAVLDLVGDVNAAQDIADLRAVILVALRRAVPAQYASYNEVHEERGPVATIVQPDPDPALFDAWQQHALSNPLIVRHARTRDGRAYRFSDVVSPADLHRLPVYRELYAPMGLEHQIAFTLPAPQGLTVGIALSRSRSRPDFSDDERAMLDLARPHLIQAYRNAYWRVEGGALPAGALRALGLTRRQAEVLSRLATGRSTTEVGAELGVSPRTVHKHTQAIYARLGVRGRGQAIAAAWTSAAAEDVDA